jgi:hypothetical protein
MNINADRQLNMYGLTLAPMYTHYSDIVAHNSVLISGSCVCELTSDTRCAAHQLGNAIN